MLGKVSPSPSLFLQTRVFHLFISVARASFLFCPFPPGCLFSVNVPLPFSSYSPPPARHLLQTEILPSFLFFSFPQAVQTFLPFYYHHSFSPSDSLSSMSLPVSAGAFKGPSPFSGRLV